MGFYIKVLIYGFGISFLISFRVYGACEQKDDDGAYQTVVDEILALPSRNIVLGENHGYEDSFVLLKNLMLKIGARGERAIFLYEVYPSAVPRYLSGELLPVTSDNFWSRLGYYDNRASCINYVTTRALIDMEHVTVDSVMPVVRKPSEISGTAWARKFAQARRENPDSYIIAIMGTSHAKPDMLYPLSEDDSLCRALEELQDMEVSCIATGTTWFQSERFDRCERTRSAILSTPDEHERQVRPKWGTSHEGFDYVVHFGRPACHVWSERYYDPHAHNAVRAEGTNFITP